MFLLSFKHWFRFRSHLEIETFFLFITVKLWFIIIIFYLQHSIKKYYHFFLHMFAMHMKLYVVFVWKMFAHFLICLFANFPICLFANFPICLFAHFPKCLFTYFPICLFAHFPIGLFTHFPICLYSHFPTCLFTHFPICLFTFPREDKNCFQICKCFSFLPKAALLHVQ